MKKRSLVNLLCLTISTSSAFVFPKPSAPHHSSSSFLSAGVIKGEALGKAPFDEGQGGVRLAQESAVKFAGEIKHKPGKAEPNLTDLLRYSKLTNVEESTVLSVLGNHDATEGSRIVCTGQGREVYKDPGETTVADVTLAPMAAVRDALTTAGSVLDCTKVVVNVLGGDDLQLLEVTDALTHLVLDMDFQTRCKISFNSLSHTSFPTECATVTVVAIGEEGGSSDGGEKVGAEKSVANGEVYIRDGTYWTVQEEDINDALA